VGTERRFGGFGGRGEELGEEEAGRFLDLLGTGNEAGDLKAAGVKSRPTPGRGGSPRPAGLPGRFGDGWSGEGEVGRFLDLLGAGNESGVLNAAGVKSLPTPGRGGSPRPVGLPGRLVEGWSGRRRC